MRTCSAAPIWVWKQACGDPQGGVTDVTDALSPTVCATGEPAPTDAAKLAILSRAYPRTAPGALTALKADGAALYLAGTADARSCDLEVWVPGSAEPDVHVTGITRMTSTAVDGGWSVTGCVKGAYTLSTGS